VNLARDDVHLFGDIGVAARERNAPLDMQEDRVERVFTSWATPLEIG
jgi:hypothetical protein